MTFQDFVNSVWGLLTAMLIASVPGAWAVYTLIKKFNLEGGTENQRTDLAKKNLELAALATEHAKELQEEIKLREAIIKEKEVSIKQYQEHVHKLKEQVAAHEDRISYLDTELIKVKADLAAEQKITSEQDVTIRYLMNQIKRDLNKRERGSDAMDEEVRVPEPHDAPFAVVPQVPLIPEKRKGVKK